jgi:hypothetical protein
MRVIFVVNKTSSFLVKLLICTAKGAAVKIEHLLPSSRPVFQGGLTVRHGHAAAAATRRQRQQCRRRR